MIEREILNIRAKESIMLPPLNIWDCWLRKTGLASWCFNYLLRSKLRSDSQMLKYVSPGSKEYFINADLGIHRDWVVYHDEFLNIKMNIIYG